MCKLGSAQRRIASFKPWTESQSWSTHNDEYDFYQHPRLDYQRILFIDSVLEFNFDRVINTDLRKLLKVIQDQKWLGLIDKKQQTVFYHETMKMINEDYEKR